MKKLTKLLFAGFLALAVAPAAVLSLSNNTHVAFADSGSGTQEDPYIISTFKGLREALKNDNAYIVVNEFETDNLDECGYYTPTQEDLSAQDALRYFTFYSGHKINLTINCDIKIKQSSYHPEVNALFGGGGIHPTTGKKTDVTFNGNGTLSYKVATTYQGVGKAIINVFDTNLTINDNLTFLPDASNIRYSDGGALSISDDSDVVINGGTFYCSNYDMYFPSHSFQASLYSGEASVTINGGKFLLDECNTSNKPAYGLFMIAENASQSENLKIYGGEFEGLACRSNIFDINSVLAPGYEFVLDDDSIVEDGVFATKAHVIAKPVVGYDYTVTFDPNGGIGTMEPVPVHTKFYTLPECEYTNGDDSLLFRGWKLSTDSEELYAPGERIELGVDTVFYASWSEKDIYEIKYDDGKGNCFLFNALEGSSFNVRTFESTGFKAPVGKYFAHWHEKWTKANVLPNESYTVPDDNTYFIAEYEPTGQTVYTLDFDNSGGTGEMESVDVIAGTFYALPANTAFSKGGAPFIGWNVGSYGLMNPYDSVFVRGNMAISAVWGEPVGINVKPIRPYTLGRVNISFDNLEAYVLYEDGTKDLIDPKNDLDFYVLNAEQEYDLIPYLPNYYPGDNITAHIKAVYKNNIELESEFDVHYGNYCFLSFDPNLEDKDTFVKYYIYGETTYLPEFPYELPDGLEFSGWRDIFGATHPAKEEVTVNTSTYYQARISSTDYTITLDHGLGSGKMDDKIVCYNSNFYLPKPTFSAPSGYEFDHWEIEGEIYQASVKYQYTWTKDITAIAIYREKGIAICVISYNANGGSKDVLPIAVSEGSEYKLPNGDIFEAPDGYEFNYWEVTIGNDSPINLNPNQSFNVSGDTKIKAIWKEITKYTISFDSNGGSGTMEDVVKPEGSSYTLPDNGFTAPEHRHFLGWSYSDSGSIISDPSITINDNIILYAIWGIDSHTIAFISSGGATGSMEPVNKDYGSEYTLPTPTFTPDSGKEFKHWEINGVEVLTSSITITGDVVLNAVYGDISTSPVLKSIALSGTYKTTFTVGDSFTSEGLVVTAHYSDDSSEVIALNDVEITGYNMNQEGKQTITVSYQGKTATYEITVKTKDTPVTPDEPVTPEEPSKSAGLPAGAVVGIVIGSALVVGVGGFALVWFVIKKKTWADFLALFKKK